MRAVNRFLNPVMKVMCTTSQTSPAIRPESLTPYALRTALRRSTAAMLPKSKYFQGVGSAPFLTRFLIDAGGMETGYNPPVAERPADSSCSSVMSPTTNTSGLDVTASTVSAILVPAICARRVGPPTMTANVSHDNRYGSPGSSSSSAYARAPIPRTVVPEVRHLLRHPQRRLGCRRRGSRARPVAPQSRAVASRSNSSHLSQLRRTRFFFFSILTRSGCSLLRRPGVWRWPSGRFYGCGC